MNKPQQPDKSLEQKIRGIIGDALASSCTREECPVAEMNCVECAVKDVLALLQPQQPVEGELVVNPYTCFCHQNREISHGEEDEDIAHHEFESGSQAQLAHDKQRMVKLPSEDELNVLLLKAHDNAIMTTFPHKTTMAHELLRLLGEVKP